MTFFILRLILIFTLILLRILFPAIYMSYMWNFGLLLTLLQFVIIINGIVNIFWYIFKRYSYGIFNSVERAYKLTIYRLIYAIFYLAFFIGLLTFLRYCNMGRKLDLKIIYNFVYERVRLLEFFSGEKVFFVMNLVLVLVIIWKVSIFLIILIRVLYEYSALCLWNIHIFLLKYQKYRMFEATLSSKLWKLKWKVICKIYHEYLKNYRTNKFVRWFCFSGIWIFFQILPICVFIVTITMDCFYNNFIIYRWSNIVIFISFYIILIKIIKFYGNRDSSVLSTRIAQKLYFIFKD